MKTKTSWTAILLGIFLTAIVFSGMAADDGKTAAEKKEAPAGKASTKPGGTEAESLIKVLQKKGVLSEKEATDLREMKGDTAGGRIKVGDWIKELKLFGDARLRYEFREGESANINTPTAVNPGVANAFRGAPTAGGYGDHYNRERWRYRLRLGTHAKFTDNWMMGLRLETSNNSRSTNVTFGDDAGPWGKATDVIYVGQLYTAWSPTEWATLMGGRMPNELMNTTLVWDSDICPEGAFEKFKYQVNDEIEFFATLGQFLYDDLNPDENIGRAPGGDDPFIFVQQVGLNVSFNKDTKLSLAPTVNVYGSPGTGDTYRGRFDATGAAAAAAQDLAVNDLLIVDVPMELKFKLWDEKFKAFSDFAVNAYGDRRARQAGRPDKDDEIYAYRVGLKWGEAKKKGGAEAEFFWQHSDLYSLDMNTMDSDVFDSKLNLEGICAGVKYAFTDFLFGGITYAFAWRADKDLPTGFNGDIAMNPMDNYQLLQCDLSWKF